MNRRAVIVGASVGGTRTAQSLRAEGFEGSIVLLDSEHHFPYDKPPLSKGFLSGSLGRDRIGLISEVDLDRLSIELRTGTTATSLDVARRSVELHDGSRIDYDYLVVATGVRARPSPWEAKEGVHLVRTLDDSEGLREDLTGAGSVAIVGAGFIGAEIAATARAFGLEVSIIDPLRVPMGRVLGDAVGERFISLHHQNGVSTYFGVGVESITGGRGNLKVELSDGTVISSDVAVVGIGAVPNDEWLASSGLLVDNGLVCDEYCRAVGRSEVFGVGDVARWYHTKHGRLVRVEHWTNAVEQGSVVAHNIVSPENCSSYAPVEYVWSDQYSWKIQMAGITSGAAHHVVIDDPSREGRFAALYSDQSGAYCGVVTVSWPRALIECRKLLAQEVDISVPVGRVTALLN